MSELSAETQLEIARLDVCVKARRVIHAWQSEGQALSPALQALSESLDVLHERSKPLRQGQPKLEEVAS